LKRGVTVVLGLALVLSFAPPAMAYGTAPEATWQADGTVRAVLQVGTTTYIGGAFTSLFDQGGDVVARNHLAALDADGVPTAWDPGANRTVSALATDGSLLYVGGSFTRTGGHAQANAAAYNLSDGSFSTAWRPHPRNGKVSALAVTDGLVYLGGAFTSIGDVPRSYLAAVTSDTGQLTGFAPTLDAPVLGVAASATQVVAVGKFAAHVASFGVDGSDEGWDPLPINCLSVAIDATNAYLACAGKGGHAFAYSLTSGSSVWGESTNGDVQAAEVGSDGLVYLGGHFSTVLRETREFLAVFSPDGRLQDYSLSFTPVKFGGIWSIDATPTGLFLGGAFTSIQGQTQRRYGVMPA